MAQLNLTELESLRKIIEVPIKLENLPKLEYVDFLIHRIMIYYDLILQENIILKSNGNPILKSK